MKVQLDFDDYLEYFKNIIYYITKYNIKGLNNYNDLYLDNIIIVNAWNE